MKRPLLVGVYQLSHDITHPRPDRRGRVWYKLPTLKAGERFIVTNAAIELESFGSSSSSGALFWGDLPDSGLVNQSGTYLKLLWPLLAEALVPAQASVLSCLQLRGANNLRSLLTLLERMVRAGKFSLADIDDAIRRLKGEGG